MFAIKNRESLPTIVLDALEDLAIRMRALFLVEHSEDGRHIVEDRDLAYTPVGFMGDWPTATPPSGWKICDGSQLSRVTYKALFDAIGTTFGSGDGSTTFNLPDARGRFALAKAAAGTGSAIGATGGALDHTHTGPSHTHTGPAHTHDAGTLAGPSHTHAAGTLEGPSHTHSTPAHVHTVSGNTGSATLHFSATAFDTNGDGTTKDGCSGIGLSAGPTFVPASYGHSHTSGTLAADSGGAGTTGSGGTGSVTGSTAAGGTGSVTGATASAGTGATGASGTDATGANNPAFIVLGHTIIFTGVAA